MELPALVEGMDFPTYLADPAPSPSVTSSLVRSLLTTAPRAVWERTPRLNPHAEVEVQTKFDIGTAAHAEFIGEGEPIVVIHADSYRTNAAKEERDRAYADQKTPVLAHDMDRVSDMAEEARHSFGKNRMLGPVLADEWLLREPSLFWNSQGVMCRCRPDLFLPKPASGGPPVVVHYKTTATTTNRQMLPRFAANQQWDMIAAHYHAGAKALTGIDPIQYFAIQETQPPYLCLVGELEQPFVETAEMRRERALEIWAKCLRENNWPGHIERAIRIPMPTWHEAQAIDAKDWEQSHKDAGADVLDVSIKWQAPLTAPETL